MENRCLYVEKGGYKYAIAMNKDNIIRVNDNLDLNGCRIPTYEEIEADIQAYSNLSSRGEIMRIALEQRKDTEW